MKIPHPTAHFKSIYVALRRSQNSKDADAPLQFSAPASNKPVIQFVDDGHPTLITQTGLGCPLEPVTLTRPEMITTKFDSAFPAIESARHEDTKLKLASQFIGTVLHQCMPDNTSPDLQGVVLFLKDKLKDFVFYPEGATAVEVSHSTNEKGQRILTIDKPFNGPSVRRGWPPFTPITPSGLEGNNQAKNIVPFARHAVLSNR
jgi:hypothetical protein